MNSLGAGSGERGEDRSGAALGQYNEGLPEDDPEPEEGLEQLAQTRPLRPWLPLAGLAAGAWAMVPPYAGPVVNARAAVEVVDHVVPGVMVLLVSAAALLLTGFARRVPRPTPMLVGGLAVFLAGFWMTATHVPLVDQLTRGEVGIGSVVHHSLPGLAVAVLGLVWATTYWHDDPPSHGQPGTRALDRAEKRSDVLESQQTDT